jgi:hypothetical protein
MNVYGDNEWALRHRGYHEEDHTPAEHRAMAARQLQVVNELLGYAGINAEKGGANVVAHKAELDRDYYRLASVALEGVV